MIRTDYNSIGENDNAAINGVAGDDGRWPTSRTRSSRRPGEQVKGARDRRRRRLRRADRGDGPGRQLHAARPTAVHLPSAEALAKPEFDAFLEFYIANQASLTEAATFVPMTEEQTQARRRRSAS